ncbi:MAG: 50S ribosomal protein L6 [Halobacteriales archaeon]|nr:50S ribosomal protein L6 [Halobacteriales archaeon]
MVVAEARESVKVPGGVSVTLAQGTVKVKGPKGELQRSFAHPRVQVLQEDGGVVVRCEMARRKDKALVGTYAAHVRNMVRGVQEEWEYKLKIVYSHFPIKAKVSGDTFIIENFLGERNQRKAPIAAGVKVKLDGDVVLVTGTDLEQVGQTAATIEQATRIRDRDPRVFQDGIYITQKPG